MASLELQTIPRIWLICLLFKINHTMLWNVTIQLRYNKFSIVWRLKNVSYNFLKLSGDSLGSCMGHKLGENFTDVLGSATSFLVKLNSSHHLMNVPNSTFDLTYTRPYWQLGPYVTQAVLDYYGKLTSIIPYDISNGFGLGPSLKNIIK